MRPLLLNHLLDAADAAGAEATRVANTAIYGTRRTPITNAGTAKHRGSPVGAIGKHSVYEGPRQIPGGAPILRREKIS